MDTTVIGGDAAVKRPVNDTRQNGILQQSTHPSMKINRHPRAPEVLNLCIPNPRMGGQWRILRECSLSVVLLFTTCFAYIAFMTVAFSVARAVLPTRMVRRLRWMFPAEVGGTVHRNQ